MPARVQVQQAVAHDIRGPVDYKRAMAADMCPSPWPAPSTSPEIRGDPMTTQISVTVNGEVHEADVEPLTLLVHFLRDDLGLTSTQSGATRAAVARAPSRSTARVPKWHDARRPGRRPRGQDHRGHYRGDAPPLQQAFWDQHGLQCGFCTLGDAHAGRLAAPPERRPSEAEIRVGISGNLCRCTGYVSIVKAIQQAAGTLREGESAPVVAAETVEGQEAARRTGRGRLSGEKRAT